ncbi:MAG TPA: LacI family transcriptional regulator [Saprospirales bacterium]|nr:LacI family transcriptional regulator [Saprospirales bacterium]HAY70995.1 LacI family transcriptional regulator [Saprospirales bacterium]HRQ30021.1 LacI family DNA-binding transcriptional regulator [Saprospiraceae bacterium]
MIRTTIKEIAKALNISVSTVSRALRDSHEISEETKIKVLKYAKKVNYTPDPLAQALKAHQSHSICVIVPEIANYFFSEVINGIDTAAYTMGYNVFVFQSFEDYRREIQSIEYGMNRRVDGFIISLSGTTDNFDHLDLLAADKVPTVFFDRVPVNQGIDKVVVDNYEGSYQGIQYLINRGKKRIACLSSSMNLSITKERLAGYFACLKDNGIEADDQLIKFCGFDPYQAVASINEIIEFSKPDAFFINSDRLTLNSLAAIREYSMQKPLDIEIVGFTNIKHYNLLNPRIVPIQQPAWEIGVKTVELLVHKIEKRKPRLEPKTYVMKTRLIES